MSFYDRLRRMAIGIDQTANAAAGGSEDETVSSRLGKAARTGSKKAQFWCHVLAWLFSDPNHCLGAIEDDE